MNESSIISESVIPHDFRNEKRDFWNKIIFLSSAILGFSVTMYGDGAERIINLCFLKVSWTLFLFNILIGLYLIYKESSFEFGQRSSRSIHTFEKNEISIPLQNDIDKCKWIAISYLELIRILPKKDIFFSEKAKKIFEEHKTSLMSWNLIKNPESFYSYSHFRVIKICIILFFTSFFFAILFLVFSIIFI